MFKNLKLIFKKNNKDIIHKRGFHGNIRKCVSVSAYKISEENSESRNIGKIENAETDYYYYFIIYMHYNFGYLFKTLASEKTFAENKQAVVKTPDYIVPACTMPEACAEPYKKKSAVRTSLAENRDI